LLSTRKTPGLHHLLQGVNIRGRGSIGRTPGHDLAYGSMRRFDTGSRTQRPLVLERFGGTQKLDTDDLGRPFDGDARLASRIRSKGVVVLHTRAGGQVRDAGRRAEPN